MVPPRPQEVEWLHQKLYGSQSLKYLLPGPLGGVCQLLNYSITARSESYCLFLNALQLNNSVIDCNGFLFSIKNLNFHDHYHVTVILKHVTIHFSGPRIPRFLSFQICELFTLRNSHSSYLYMTIVKLPPPFLENFAVIENEM